MHTYSFENQEAWKLSRALNTEVYQLVSTFPNEEKFGLISQIKRSVSSIGSCLAEGSGRTIQKDKAHFSSMAYPTALETLNHLICAWDLDYISDDEYIKTRTLIEQVALKITLLRKGLLK